MQNKFPALLGPYSLSSNIQARAINFGYILCSASATVDRRPLLHSISTMQSQLDEYLQNAVSVAKEAGNMIKEAIYKEHKIDTKVSPVDLVTETDKAVEKHIFSRLLSIYPSHATIGEESASENAQVRCELSDTPTWIVDPIDGTTNFVHRYPYTCVSIGLTIKKHVVIGVIYNPLVDEMYTATRGGGAYLNGKRLSVTKSEALRGSLVICELGSDRAEEVLDARLAHIKAVIREAHGVRCCGSAALNLCALAAGRADAYLDFGLHCWDVAAGALILNEAGGVVTNVPPGDSAEALTVQGCLQHYDMMRRHVLAASTPQLAREIASCIKPVYYQPE